MQQCAAFYRLLKNYDEDTYKIVYDLQQVQVLNKVPVQEAFYARQLALYNFAVPDMLSGKNYCYTWIESEEAHVSNEIASAMYHFLSKVFVNFGSYRHHVSNYTAMVVESTTKTTSFWA